MKLFALLRPAFFIAAAFFFVTPFSQAEITVNLIGMRDITPPGSSLDEPFESIGRDHNGNVCYAVSSRYGSNNIDDVCVYRFNTVTSENAFLGSLPSVREAAGKLGPKGHWPNAEGMAKFHSYFGEFVRKMYFSSHDFHSIKLLLREGSDSDGDDVVDALDTCPEVPDPRQKDLDEDGEGDLCDLDTDGDDIPDTWEVKHGLDPRRADAQRDEDGDGFTSIEEYEFSQGHPTLDSDPLDPNSNPGKLTFAQDLIEVSESGVTVNALVRREGGTLGEVSVNCYTKDGTAHSGADYIERKGPVLIWADGQAGNKACRVALKDDAEVRGARVFSLQLGSPMGSAKLGAATSVSVRILDDDGHKIPGATVGFYNSEAKVFQLRKEGNADANGWQYAFGPGGEGTALTGDWDGDGVETAGWYQSATGKFYLRNVHAGGKADRVYSIKGWRGEGLIPIAGDWNGNGIDTIGLYDPKKAKVALRNKHKRGKPNRVVALNKHYRDLQPIVGNWNGKGGDTVGFYDPIVGTVFLFNDYKSGKPALTYQMNPKSKKGSKNGIAIAGDWDGKGYDKTGLYHPAKRKFILRKNHETAGPVTDIRYGKGGAGQQPIAGNWDGS